LRFPYRWLSEHSWIWGSCTGDYAEHSWIWGSRSGDYQSTIFWDVTLCSPVDIHWFIQGTFCLHFQGRRVKQVRNQQEVHCKHSLHYTNMNFYLYLAVIYGSLLNESSLNCHDEYSTTHSNRNGSSLKIRECTCLNLMKYFHLCWGFDKWPNYLTCKLWPGINDSSTKF
jgi:hypothetical protein